MEVVLALVAVALLGYWFGRRRRRRHREPFGEVGGFLAGGVPAVLAHDDRDVRVDVEEGALDPDELDDLPPDWDEGADDEID